LKEKNMMKSKMTFSGAAALVLGAGVLIASVAPASAQEWRPRHAHTWHTWGPAAVAGGIVGGAVAAATSPLWAPGGYGYGPDYGYGPGYYGRDYAYGNGPYDYDAGPPLLPMSRKAALSIENTPRFEQKGPPVHAGGRFLVHESVTS
jgi:hypothetical protein